MIKYNRRNLVVDIDRTFVDIILAQQYHTTLRSLQSELKSAFIEGTDMHWINFNGNEFLVVIRKGAQEFFQVLSKKFELYVVTHICKDLVLQILRLLDP